MAQDDMPQNAVSKALRVLSLLAQSHDPLRLGEVSAAMAMPKSTVHRILTILVEESYAEPAGGGLYRPGDGLRVLAAGMEGHRGSGIEAALKNLGTTIGHTVFLAMLSGDSVTYTHKVDPGLAYNIAHDVGSQLPITRSAAGKAILAHLPDGDRDRALTPSDDRPAFLRELKAIRKRGFATDYGDVDASLCSICAPVLDNTGYPVAAVCASSLVFVVPVEDLERMGGAVIATADEVARRL